MNNFKRKHERAGDDDSLETPSKKILRSPSALTVQPLNQFDKPFPFFREPKMIGSFSQDSDRKFQHNDSSLKFYIEPKDYRNVNFDLKVGFSSFIRKDDSVEEYLDDLLRWIILNRELFHSTQVGSTDSGITSLKTDFICWRGLLTQILCTPYEHRDGWIIGVIKFRDTHYLCNFDTEERVQQKASQTDQQKLFEYGGFKFEQYLTSSELNGNPDTSEPVNSKEGFCRVVRSRLDQHSLVYGGEVDCCQGPKEAHKYVELKTSRDFSNANQFRNFKRFKLIKWWCQSFLLGIPEVICGFRDDDSIVHRLESFRTLAIPKYCRDVHNCWQPHVCFNFCNIFLQHIKDVVRANDPGTVTLFHYFPSEKRIVHEQHKGDSKYNFIPQWYLDSWTDLADS